MNANQPPRQLTNAYTKVLSPRTVSDVSRPSEQSSSAALRGPTFRDPNILIASGDQWRKEMLSPTSSEKQLKNPASIIEVRPINPRTDRKNNTEEYYIAHQLPHSYLVGTQIESTDKSSRGTQPHGNHAGSTLGSRQNESRAFGTLSSLPQPKPQYYQNQSDHNRSRQSVSEQSRSPFTQTMHSYTLQRELNKSISSQPSHKNVSSSKSKSRSNSYRKIVANQVSKHSKSQTESLATKSRASHSRSQTNQRPDSRSDYMNEIAYLENLQKLIDQEKAAQVFSAYNQTIDHHPSMHQVQTFQPGQLSQRGTNYSQEELNSEQYYYAQHSSTEEIRNNHFEFQRSSNEMISQAVQNASKGTLSPRFNKNTSGPILTSASFKTAHLGNAMSQQYEERSYQQVQSFLPTEQQALHTVTEEDNAYQTQSPMGTSAYTEEQQLITRSNSDYNSHSVSPKRDNIGGLRPLKVRENTSFTNNTTHMISRVSHKDQASQKEFKSTDTVQPGKIVSNFNSMRPQERQERSLSGNSKAQQSTQQNPTSKQSHSRILGNGTNVNSFCNQDNTNFQFQPAQNHGVNGSGQLFYVTSNSNSSRQPNHQVQYFNQGSPINNLQLAQQLQQINSISSLGHSIPDTHQKQVPYPNFVRSEPNLQSVGNQMFRAGSWANTLSQQSDQMFHPSFRDSRAYLASQHQPGVHTNQGMATMTTGNDASIDVTEGSSNAPTPTNPTIMRHELLQARKQIGDYRSTTILLKKDRLKFEHEKNLLEIKVKQLEEELKQKEESRSEEKTHIQELASRYNQQEELGKMLSDRQKSAERQYRQKLVEFNKQLESLKSSKFRNLEKVQTNVHQLKAGFFSLHELIEVEHPTLVPFINYFLSVSTVLESNIGFPEEAILNRDPNSCSPMELKQLKRLQNFQKFRKEIRTLIKRHFAEKCTSYQTRIGLLEKDLELAMQNQKDHSDPNEVAQVIGQLNQLQLEKDIVERNAIAEIERLTKKHLHVVKKSDHRAKAAEAKLVEKSRHVEELSKRLNDASETVAELHSQVNEMQQIHQDQAHALQSQYQQIYELSHQLEAAHQRSATYSERSDQEMHQELERVCEERHLLVLQNEQYKQTLEGQAVLIEELHKAVREREDQLDQALHNQDVQQLYSPQPTVKTNYTESTQQKRIVSSFPQTEFTKPRIETSDQKDSACKTFFSAQTTQNAGQKSNYYVQPSLPSTTVHRQERSDQQSLIAPMRTLSQNSKSPTYTSVASNMASLKQTNSLVGKSERDAKQSTDYTSFVADPRNRSKNGSHHIKDNTTSNLPTFPRASEQNSYINIKQSSQNRSSARVSSRSSHSSEEMEMPVNDRQEDANRDQKTINKSSTCTTVAPITDADHDQTVCVMQQSSGQDSEIECKVFVRNYQRSQIQQTKSPRKTSSGILKDQRRTKSSPTSQPQPRNAPYPMNFKSPAHFLVQSSTDELIEIGQQSSINASTCSEESPTKETRVFMKRSDLGTPIDLQTSDTQEAMFQGHKNRDISRVFTNADTTKFKKNPGHFQKNHKHEDTTNVSETVQQILMNPQIFQKSNLHKKLNSANSGSFQGSSNTFVMKENKGVSPKFQAENSQPNRQTSATYEQNEFRHLKQKKSAEHSSNLIHTSNSSHSRTAANFNTGLLSVAMPTQNNSVASDTRKMSIQSKAQQMLLRESAKAKQRISSGFEADASSNARFTPTVQLQTSVQTPYQYYQNESSQSSRNFRKQPILSNEESSNTRYTFNSLTPSHVAQNAFVHQTIRSDSQKPVKLR